MTVYSYPKSLDYLRGWVVQGRPHVLGKFQDIGLPSPDMLIFGLEGTCMLLSLLLFVAV